MRLTPLLRLAVVPVLLLAVAGCAWRSEVPTDPAVGAVHGRVGPGAPPEGEVPARLDVVFTRGDEQVRATARDGEYELELPAGRWDVRTADGLGCDLDVVVQGAVRQAVHLLYPADCEA